MKRILLLCGALLALTATAALPAGLDLTWNACPTIGGSASNVVFDCVGATPASMYGALRVPVVIDSVVAMDWVMDLTVDAPNLPTFWQMETGDCNDPAAGGGFALSAFKPLSGCGTALTIVATWGTPATGTVSGQGYLDAGRPTVPPGPNRARFLCTISRPATSPIRLNTTSRYFGFGMTFILDFAVENGFGTCEGCPLRACILWNATKLISTSRDPFNLEGPDAVGNQAAINGGSVGACIVDPVRKKTWGQIKALYR